MKFLAVLTLVIALLGASGSASSAGPRPPANLEDVQAYASNIYIGWPTYHASTGKMCVYYQFNWVPGTPPNVWNVQLGHSNGFQWNVAGFYGTTTANVQGNACVTTFSATWSEDWQARLWIESHWVYGAVANYNRTK